MGGSHYKQKKTHLKDIRNDIGFSDQTNPSKELTKIKAETTKAFRATNRRTPFLRVGVTPKTTLIINTFYKEKSEMTLTTQIKLKYYINILHLCL